MIIIMTTDGLAWNETTDQWGDIWNATRFASVDEANDAAELVGLGRYVIHPVSE